ncbi:hypothetical protein TONV_075 [Tipula oleracea nudivirus]|uniref:Uncharacterized protein n=1 Tax=Tipula oleracea nudivirus TaxID=1546257 RepID=A0A0B4VFH0_9VIRU|nr:hypothetical protein TONV_075 [Tipula oleracea nudivirus]AJD20135.1 hypothetical protein TONV_075 [Tipula oleracea nudivirus]
MYTRNNFFPLHNRQNPKPAKTDVDLFYFFLSQKNIQQQAHVELFFIFSYLKKTYSSTHVLIHF